MDYFLEELTWLYAMGGVMRAGVDAARLLQMGAQIARGRFLFNGSFFASRMIRILGHDFEGMQVDVAVRTIARAEAAADAPVFNNHFQRIAPANGADWAANHAERVAALTAARCDQIVIEAQSIAHQPRNAVVRIGACVNA